MKDFEKQAKKIKAQIKRGDVMKASWNAKCSTDIIYKALKRKAWSELSDTERAGFSALVEILNERACKGRMKIVYEKE